MRIGVISDVHADLLALESVLATVERVQLDAIWCLGDIVGLGGNAPAEAIDLVRARSALVLAGNHDRWVTGTLPLDMLPLPRQRAELESQRAQLSSEQLEWLASLPSHARRDGIELWHGSAEDPVTGWIANELDATNHLVHQSVPIGLVGHTHRPMFARLQGRTMQWNEHPDREQLSGLDRTVLNPGAVTRTHCWLELDIPQQLAVWHRG